MDVQIRLAESKDIPFIFGLVKELAAYENAEDQVWTSKEIYFADFKKGVFKSLVACLNDQVLGTCIYYPAYSTWKGKMMYLEDFIVFSDGANFSISVEVRSQSSMVDQGDIFFDLTESKVGLHTTLLSDNPTASFDVVDPAPVPLPGALWLMALACSMLTVKRRFRL